jgi:hypothetical protein
MIGMSMKTDRTKPHPPPLLVAFRPWRAYVCFGFDFLRMRMRMRMRFDFGFGFGFGFDFDLCISFIRTRREDSSSIFDTMG